MKRYIFSALALLTTVAGVAQNTYQNDVLVGGDDLFGSARYVGMGGAMGALGADISVMGTSPAGIGLYRRTDISLTAGAYMPKGGNGFSKNDPRTYGEKLPRAAFDQCGFVVSMGGFSPKLKHLNVGFNYQKRANYNRGMYADISQLNGLSLLDHAVDFVNCGYDTNDYDGAYNNFPGYMADCGILTKDQDGNYINHYSGERSFTTQHSTGSLQEFDFNISGNVDDRIFWGVTIAADNVDYNTWSNYSEENSMTIYDVNNKPTAQYGDFSLYRDQKIDGFGIRGLVGLIVRPMEDSPLRVGLTMETPTWYRLKNSTVYSAYDDAFQQGFDAVESYLEYTVRTPLKGRLSVGSTVGNSFAWDVEYEFANYAKTSQGYPKWDSEDPNHSAFASNSDIYMNSLTEKTLRGQHTIKAGVEWRPMPSLALRAGYNYISSRYKDNPTFDQWTLARGNGTSNAYSQAMDLTTGADYMSFGGTNIMTLGIGYKWKHFYADFAYKVRRQSADYYAFDATYAQEPTVDSSIMGKSISPAGVDFVSQQLSCTLGLKF